ncbi:MAG: mitochondral 37S ribosomal protein S27 [Trizodia sp. TS-e1964]|nr:MAG: mitochondral 37S ribosomal protein S27 [Trizodia sp. TS-e1964]
MAVPRSRLLELMKVQCRIFSTTYNPEGVRTGNKILRQRLRGPALASYYPRRVVTLKDLAAAFPDLEFYDEDEEDRLESIQVYVWFASVAACQDIHANLCRQCQIERKRCTQEEEERRR